VERFGFNVGRLLAVNFNNYTPSFIMDSLGHSDCVIKEMFRVKINTFPKRMFFVNRNRLYAVESKDIDLRYAIGGFLTD
jgi:hypothetical protein